jgi:hypothetical protein
MITDRSQRWRERRAKFRPAGEVFDPSGYGVEIIPDDRTAKAFIERHHYAHSSPSMRLRLGLYRSRAFFAPELMGVCAFTVPQAQTVIPKYARGVVPNDGVELGRLVLLDEVAGNAESWFVSRCLRILRSTLKNIRIVVSFSDPVRRVAEDGTVIMPGHIGDVYKALSARYVGPASPKTMHLARDGRTVSERAKSKIRNDEKGRDYAYRQLLSMGAPPRQPFEEGPAYLERALAAAFREIRHPGNHAYCWPLRSMADGSGPLTLLPAKPYPTIAVREAA